ncbi:Sodium/potassium-transporting ATPase subunit alpha-4 [Bienertia sinuspersici]
MTIVQFRNSSRRKLVKGYPGAKRANREYDDPCSKDVAGSSNDPSNSQQRYNENDDHSQIQDEQEASNLLKPEKESCKGPFGGNEREDKDDPHGDDGVHSRGPAKSNEAENTGKLRQGVDESSRDSSKNEENKKADDAPRDLEGALIPFIFDDLKLSCSNERWPCDLAACLSIQDLQKISGARILSEFPLFFLSYMLPAYMRALRVCIFVDVDSWCHTA